MKKFFAGFVLAALMIGGLAYAAPPVIPTPGSQIVSPTVNGGQFPFICCTQAAAVNANGGTFTANGASAVTVANTNLTANSIILVTLKTVGGTVGALPVPQTVTPGTGFTISGTSGDTSVYNYLIIG